MTDSLQITPASGPVRGTIRPPGSKSITNRALICAALADGESTLTGALDSEDTQVMIDSLRRLGVAIDVFEPRPSESKHPLPLGEGRGEGSVGSSGHTLHVTGCGGKIPATQADLYIANSGTSVRFLTALAALGHGRFRLHGTPRMHQRPIHDLLDGLSQLGVNLNSEAGNGCPPVVVQAAGLPGGHAKIRGDVSSQFLSGLLLAAPYAQKPVQLIVKGELVSQPYVHLTLAVMRAFGVDVPAGDLRHFNIPLKKYSSLSNYSIEPDATAASYFFAAAAITGGTVTVEGLSRHSLQGDVAFCDCLEQMGCRIAPGSTGGPDSGPTDFSLSPPRERAGVRGPDGITVSAPPSGQKLRGITVNMNAISDTVQTLAAVALFADGPTTITGVGHIRHKETDRIGNLAIELRKFGATVDELPDGLRIVPPANLPLPPGEGRVSGGDSPWRGEGSGGGLHGARIATYHDHRMAMSLALVGLRLPGVIIEDPKCVEKTSPQFFADLKSLTI